MEQTIKVSACIITYNQEKYIEQCLEGAINQKLEYDYEIIIGEDNSSDKTREICERYMLKYPDLIKLYPRRKNYGMIGNWVQSLKDCSGDYIAICEGDDFWKDPLKLQKQVDFLKTHDDFGLSCTSCDRYYEELEVYSKAKMKSKKIVDITFESLLFSNPIKTCTTVVRSSLIYKYFNTIGNDFSNFKMADAPLWIFISMNHKIKFHYESTAVYRILESSATNVPAYEKLLFRISRYRVSFFFLRQKFSYGLAWKLVIKFLKEFPVLMLKTILSEFNLYTPNKKKVIEKRKNK